LEFNDHNRLRRRHFRFAPIALPLVTLGVKVAFHPASSGYSWGSLGFDLAFIGVAFYTWALMTIAAQRRVSHGGFFEFPTATEDRTDLVFYELGLSAVLMMVTYAGAAVCSRMVGSLGLDWRTVAVGLLLAFVLPYGMIDASFLPPKLKDAP
jgi:hypothetical protein